MTDQPSRDPDDANEHRTAQFIGIGCLMTVLGGLSMAMAGVLLSTAVAFFTKAPRCDGLPTCNWHVYAGAGFVFGAVTLPMLVLNRLRLSAQDAKNNRG